MPLDLLKRSESGNPLTATEHDTNFTAIENFVNSLETTLGNKIDAAALGDLALKNELELSDVPNGLLTLAKLTTLAANKLLGSIDGTSNDQIDLTAFGRSLIAAQAAANARTLLVSAKAASYAQKTSNYTLVLDDQDKVIDCSHATGMNVTIPNNTTVAFPIPTLITLFQTNVGAVTVVAGSGVTINKPAALTLTTRDRYSAISLLKYATDTWLVGGRLGDA